MELASWLEKSTPGSESDDEGSQDSSSETSQTDDEAHGETAEADLDPADVFFRVDIFDAVAVSAFGGVQMNLDGAEEMNIHPAVLWAFVVPLVCAQIALAFCVGLNIDLDAPVVRGNTQGEGMEVTIKVLLIVVLQVTFFERMLGTLRLWLFCLNPASWTDVKRIHSGFRRDLGSRCWWLHSSIILWVFPAMSLFAKLCVNYYVNVLSVSIILAAEDLNSAIFDSLAIAFILELDGVVWNFTKTILHLDDFDSFVFRLWNIEEKDKHAKNSMMRCVVRNKMFKCLHRGKGARRLENGLSFLCMYGIYTRLLMMILYALQTNVVPAARDVCMEWRWLNGETRSPPAILARWIINFLLYPFKQYWTPLDEVRRKAEPICGNGEKEDISSDHWGELIANNLPVVVTVSVVLVGLLIVPELFLEKGVLRKKLLQWDAKEAENVEAKRLATQQKLKEIHQVMEISAKSNAKRIHDLRRRLDSTISHSRDQRQMIEDLKGQVARLSEAFPLSPF